MPAEIGGYQFDCCLRDMVARDVFFAGCFATQEIAFLRGVLRPGMRFVDVGANWGLFTLVAAYLVGTSGTVAAMEPDPRIFGRLKANVERNNLKQVQVFEVAIADRDSSLLLAAHDHGGNNWGISRLIEGDAADEITLNVSSRQLDPLLDEAGIETIDLLKIDVEGAEDMVLKGMDSGLSSHRYRRILLELHPLELAERGRTACEVIEELISKGYEGYAFDNSKAAVRRAYYHPWLHFSEYIRPLQQGLTDAAPHTLWFSPGTKS
ncbi:MAG TPA: FkbM family methyltransferase [Candidatus Angelobacter sp.]